MVQMTDEQRLTRAGYRITETRYPWGEIGFSYSPGHSQMRIFSTRAACVGEALYYMAVDDQRREEASA
jgi:hypothetical protein